MLVLITSLLPLLLLAQGGLTLRIRNFEVPLHVHRGERAVLKCEFDLQGEHLYSVKWYKGGREFFRYVPNDNPSKQAYNITGISVDKEASSGQIVVLKDVALETSGRYRCEVLGEAPGFNTMVEHAILTVVVIPKEKPVVQGAQEHYRPGDKVRVNCTSAPSKPAATLTWYINDKRVPNSYIINYTPEMLPDGLEQSTQGLHFKATHEHFPGNVMSLRCSASIGILYNKTEEANMETQHPALSLESREHLFGSHGCSLYPNSLGLAAAMAAWVLGALR